MIAMKMRNGVTLLEVVLALTLAGGVVSGGLSFYRNMLDARGRITAAMQTVESQRLLMDRITNELRAAFSDKYLDVGVEGGGQSIRLVSADVPGAAVWAVHKPSEAPVPPEYDVRLVGYRLASHIDEATGQTVVDGLERTCQKILTAPQVREGKEVEVLLLSRQVKFLAFRFLAGGAWQLSHRGADLPNAVEICMGAEPLPEGTAAEDYPYPVFRRVVWIPGAAEAVGGTIIRGLEGGADQ